jgi:hypothetical protein
MPVVLGIGINRRVSKTRQFKNATSSAQYLHFSWKRFEKELLKIYFSLMNKFALLSHCGI